MKNPLVSVIIPAYNCAATIAAAIDSALDQDVPVEILVIDDGSSDDLDAVMDRYKDVQEVFYVQNERNMGVAGTRNRGVAMAKGSHVAFLDGDDYWTPGKLQKQLVAMEKTGAVLCSTARELMTPDGKLTGRVIPVKEKISYGELLKHNSINCSSVLIRAEVAREFPMEHDDSHEDYILWLRVLKKYGSACAVNEPLLKYRLSNSGKSGNKFRSARMTYRVYRHMGFGLVKSCCLFVSYAFHGIKKYALSYLGVKDEA